MAIAVSECWASGAGCLNALKLPLESLLKTPHSMRSLIRGAKWITTIILHRTDKAQAPPELSNTPSPLQLNVPTVVAVVGKSNGPFPSPTGTPVKPAIHNPMSSWTSPSHRPLRSQDLSFAVRGPPLTDRRIAHYKSKGYYSSDLDQFTSKPSPSPRRKRTPSSPPPLPTSLIDLLG